MRKVVALRRVTVRRAHTVVSTVTAVERVRAPVVGFSVAITADLKGREVQVRRQSICA